jgi:hypothetical protein
MKGYDNQLYITMAIICSGVALLQIVAALYWPKIARWSFAILFGWASFINWKTALNNPSAYLEYANLTWSDVYASFIRGWFSEHTLLIVGIIATAQALIAFSMLQRGLLFRIGAWGAMAFLLSIIPLGIGSGFPCTLIMTIAVAVLLRHHEKMEQARFSMFQQAR